jgi:hypothetical protein
MLSRYRVSTPASNILIYPADSGLGVIGAAVQTVRRTTRPGHTMTLLDS